jgi:hypothetical protein
MPRVAEDEVPPFRTEKPAHDPTSQDNMPLSLWALHIGFSEISEIVGKEGNPKPGIPRETV